MSPRTVRNVTIKSNTGFRFRIMTTCGIYCKKQKKGTNCARGDDISVPWEKCKRCNSRRIIKTIDEDLLSETEKAENLNKLKEKMEYIIVTFNLCYKEWESKKVPLGEIPDTQQENMHPTVPEAICLIGEPKNDKEKMRDIGLLDGEIAKACNISNLEIN